MSFFNLSLALACFLGIGLALIQSSNAQNSKQDYLNAHNAARRAVGVSNIVWDNNLANYALKYANSRRSDCAMLHSRGPYGENLAKGSSPTFSGVSAVNLWVAEKAYYNYRTNTCQTGKIQEIVTTGKLSKLEHFETDEKVKAISLFGEVWGIGPATAMKLYEKGYRTLEDLKNEPSLTHAQQLGLKYFKDIQTRIPRHEVQEMEQLLQKAGEELLPGVVIVCGGSYRRGKSSCGDMDIVITHPDGKRYKDYTVKN